MSTPKEISKEHIFYGLVIFAIPLWLVYFGPSQRVWSGGMMSILEGNTLYVIDAANSPNPYTTKYVYLPVFAMGMAIPAFPMAIIWTIVGLGSGLFKHTVGWFIGMTIGFIGYVGIIYLIKENVRYRYVMPALLSVGLLPWLLINMSYRGADVMVTFLILAGVFSFYKRNYLLAGVFISLATFKFTAIPLMIVFIAYIILNRPGRVIKQVLSGVFLAQVPNLAYFAMYPSDLIFIIQRKGALSTYSYKENVSLVFGLEISDFGITTVEYADQVFPFIVVIGIVLGLIVTEYDMLLGLLVAYVPMSLLVPAEQRVTPLVVLTILLFIPLLEKRIGQIGFMVLVMVTSQHLIETFLLAGSRFDVFWDLRYLFDINVILPIVFFGLVIYVVVNKEHEFSRSLLSQFR